jgi:cystathionine beta-lyase/cystathionine gamma-synthase
MSGFGGMLSFELRDPNRVQPVLRSMKLVTQALSLGGVETLACVPALTSHVKMPPEERRAAGISDGLIRVSTGVEAIEDILADFDQALGAGA